MGIYERYCLPHLIHLACGSEPVRRQRQKVIPLATGRVLEIGMGSGLNIAHYDPDKVEWVWGLEPSLGMRQKSRSRVANAPFEIRWLDLPGEQIPLADQSVDTVVLTYTLCTIADWQLALDQMRRVLKPGGTLLFCEHGEAPDRSIRRWQSRLNPLWRRLAGGCHLDRPIPQLLVAGGFEVQSLETMYIPGPKFASFNYWGSARRPA
jgi:SAM-dependent methyltransferase